MIVGCRDALGVIVKQSRYERADHKVMCLEGLMHRRRLMDSSGDRLEVFNVEDPWVEIAIPTHHVERMVIQKMLAKSVPYLDANFKFAALGMSFKLFGQAN